MNLARIQHSAAEIEKYEKALNWLVDHGQKITREMGERVSYKANFAGSCDGSSEASTVLAAMMSNRLPDLIPDAIDNCRNTIEIHRQVILDEASH